MDALDRASEYEERHRQAALDNQLRPSKVEGGSRGDVPDGVCIDCDGDIEQARLQFNARALRCSECQGHFDRESLLRQRAGR